MHILHMSYLKPVILQLISLRRLLLILETSDEILPPVEETDLGNTVEVNFVVYILE